MPRKKNSDLKFPPGVSHEWRPSGSLRLKWRNRIQRTDGSVEIRPGSKTVYSVHEAHELAVVISRSLREQGYYIASDSPCRPADDDLEDIFLAYWAWKRDFVKRAENTTSNIAHAFGRFTKGHRHLLGLGPDDTIAARTLTLSSYQEWVKWANTLGHKGSPYGEGTVYQTAFVILDAWAWAADQSEHSRARWPTLPAPPYNRSSHLPPKPYYEAPTDIAVWSEVDAVVNRIYTDLPPTRAANVYRAFWMAVMERYTGLRQFQVAGIYREDLDVEGLTLLVRRGKSKREKALNRRMAASHHLFRDLAPLLDDVKSGPLFPDSLRPNEPVRGYRNATRYVSEGWHRAIEEDKARETVLNPPGRAKGMPNHAFRGSIMQALEDADIRASVIDWLVGHAPASTRARHYTRASMDAQRKAIDLVPPLSWEDQPFPRRFGLFIPTPASVNLPVQWATYLPAAPALS